MATAPKNFDVVVIGSGPGGYVCAIRCAQLGFKTAVIEKDPTFGGTCLNVGCIPSKALLESSEHYHAAKEELSDHGVQLGSVKLDLSTMMERKSKIVGDLTNGVAFLFKKNKIESFQGHGIISGPQQVDVQKDGKVVETLQAQHIVIATGSVPTQLPFLPYDEKTSRILHRSPFFRQSS